MHLKKIALLNFKNISQEELALCPGINCLVGDNGAGKTNVVDAVYYLSMCKSSLPMTDGQSIRHGADFFLVEGTYASDAGKRETIVCSFSRKGGKVLKRNGKEYERLSDHVGLIPAVIVSPADSALISDAADERRRYLNAFISQLDRAYLGSVMRYNAVLAERNRLLKTRPDETMLQIYDMQLCEHGKAIHARRQEFAERLQPVADWPYLEEHNILRAARRGAHNTLAWKLADSQDAADIAQAVTHARAALRHAPIEDESVVQPFLETAARALLRAAEADPARQDEARRMLERIAALGLAQKGGITDARVLAALQALA